MQTLKIAPEYFCSPLWIKRSGEDVFIPILPHEIHLSQSLSDRIIEWDDKYQATFNDTYPPESGFKNADDEAAYRQEGMDIRKEITGQLSEEWMIEYKL